jgi:hypothetical protein
METRQFPARLSRAWLPWSGGNMCIIVDFVALGAKINCQCLPRPSGLPPEAPRGDDERVDPHGRSRLSFLALAHC